MYVYGCNRYRYTYQEPMPVEQLVRHICDYKQAYTQYGGLRPFGVAFLFAGKILNSCEIAIFIYVFVYHLND